MDYPVINLVPCPGVVFAARSPLGTCSRRPRNPKLGWYNRERPTAEHAAQTMRGLLARRKTWGWLADLLKEYPALSVGKERLAFQEERLKQFEAENKQLKEKVAALTTENEELKRRIAEAPVAAEAPKETPQDMYGCYYFGGDSSKLYCPRCYEQKGKKHLMAALRHVGHKCTVCENFIPR
jgi:hypothetical protein